MRSPGLEGRKETGQRYMTYHVSTIPEGRKRWTLGRSRRESLRRRLGRGFLSIARADHDLRGRSVDAAPRFCRLTRRRKELISRNFVKPSNGLEPLTPSLPFRCARNYWRPEATDSACLGRFGRCRTCAGSPPFAPALLHKCSMLGRPSRHQHLARRRRLGLLLGGASRRSAAVRGQRGDRRGGLLCPRVLYVRRSELKEISRDAVDVSSFDEAKQVASGAEEERRIIEAEPRRLRLDVCGGG